jgi:hypothetical protein
MRYRPASGNSAHFVHWAREASVAVESAFVYATAFNAGSVLVCVLQKRGDTEGPDARTDVAPGTLIAVRNYVVPPNSPVVPERVYVVVVPPNEQSSDLVLRISMGYGITGGWGDTSPWPLYSSAYQEVKVTSVTSQTEFEVETDSSLPGGVSLLSGADAPGLMLWDDEDSVWVDLDVNEVSTAGVTATIKLNAGPTGLTIAVDQRLSPYTDRLTIISGALTDYFDELGPGEVVDLTTDPRAARAYRHPPTNEQYQSRAGQAVISRIIDALGGLTPDVSLDYISRNEPDLPGDISDGPNIVTMGHASIFPL